MASLKNVRIKITGVSKTKQITKAMNMVASSKLRGAQQRMEHFRPFAEKFNELLANVTSRAGDDAHPLLAAKEDPKITGIILITSDRGLCGGFNTHLIGKAMKLAGEARAEGKSVKFYCLGRKGCDAARKSPYELVQLKTEAGSTVEFSTAAELGLQVIDDYLAGNLDEVYLIYGQFFSLARQDATVQPLLPMSNVSAAVAEEEAVEKRESGDKQAAASAAPSAVYEYEPDAEELLADLLPRFIKVQIFRGMLDSSTSEQAARMTAMDNATRACNDMLNSLTLIYNKTRQTAITLELMDIVGGADALKG